MKVLNIKYYFSIVSFILLNGLVKAQDSLLIPKYFTIQHAGSIGYLSVGAGYDLFKNKRGSLDFAYGYVPKSKGGPLNILTTKFAYRPFEISLSDKIEFYPINPGVFVSYHTGSEFDIAFDRDQYERGYYGWSTAIRGHLSVSNEIKFKTNTRKLKSVKLYSEFNVNDLYLVSLFYKNNSKWLKPEDIIKLGIGVKAGF